MMTGDAPSTSNRLGVRGYVTNQEFGGMQIPVPVQNLVLRDYAAKNSLIFELSVGEYFFPNCFVQLDGLLKSLKNLRGVAMCSLFMLPKNALRRQAIYDEFIKHGAALHLVFESLVIHNSEDVKRAEDIIRFQDVLDACPKTIPPELLSPVEGVVHFA